MKEIKLLRKTDSKLRRGRKREKRRARISNARGRERYLGEKGADEEFGGEKEREGEGERIRVVICWVLS